MELYLVLLPPLPPSPRVKISYNVFITRGAQAAVVVFSCVDRPSLVAVKRWRKKVEDECGDIPMVIVMNKIDLISQSHVNQ